MLFLLLAKAFAAIIAAIALVATGVGAATVAKG